MSDDENWTAPDHEGTREHVNVQRKGRRQESSEDNAADGNPEGVPEKDKGHKPKKR